MAEKPKTRKEYVEWYYSLSSNGVVDKEIKSTGIFIAKNATGIVLDCGCGPSPQLWAICMPNATEINAIDISKESIAFVKKKLKEKDWYKTFSSYQKIAGVVGKLPKDYIPMQIKKIKSVKQADMSKKIPFPNGYFDTVMSLYSLGVLKNDDEVKIAIKNMHNALKRGGKLIHINTNGHNSNDVLPEYTWNGVSQLSSALIPILKGAGFADIKMTSVKVDSGSAYKYDRISFLIATKK